MTFRFGLVQEHPQQQEEKKKTLLMCEGIVPGKNTHYESPRCSADRIERKDVCNCQLRDLT